MIESLLCRAGQHPVPVRAVGLLPANDFGAGNTNPPDVSILDLSLANYDLVMTADDPVSRPDPFTGQLLPISAPIIMPSFR